MNPSNPNHEKGHSDDGSRSSKLYPRIESIENAEDNSITPVVQPSTSFSSSDGRGGVYPKIVINDNGEPLQTVDINSDHEAGSSSPQRTTSTGSIQDSLNKDENPNNDTDSILNSLTRKNKNLAPLFTRDYYGGNSFPGSGTAALGKGWKALSSLEKSLSVSLGVVSTLAVALMIAVIVVGVQLNDENNCKLVLTSPPVTCPPIPSTTEKDDRCNLERPRPPRRTTPRTPSSQSGGGGKPISSLSSASCLISSELHNNSTICLSPACFRIAGGIIQAIDFDTDPCENFYQFACGGSIKSNPALEMVDQSRAIHKRLLGKIRDILEVDHSQSTSPSRSFRLAQQYYHSCMNPLRDDEVAVVEMRTLLEMMTSAPSPAVPDDPRAEISTKLHRIGMVLTNIRRILNGNYIIHVDVSADGKNSTENAIYLNHPEFGLPSLLRELDIIDPLEDVLDRNSVKIGMQSQQKNGKSSSYFYRALVKKLWSLVYPEDATYLEGILLQIEDFEGKLKRISDEADFMEDGANRENPERYYNPLSELERTQKLSSTMVSWLMEFTTNVIQERNVAAAVAKSAGDERQSQGQQRSEMPKVIVKNVNYFKGLEGLLKETSGETIGKYLKMRILLAYAHTGKIFAEVLSDFKRKVEGEMYVPVARWQTCAKETSQLFGWTISNVLVQSSFDSVAIQEQLNETASYLKESLNESLSIGLPWISTNKTRLAAQRKLELLQTFLGFPTEWAISSVTDAEGDLANEATFNSTKSDAFVEDFYSDMNFTDPFNYIQNYVEMRMWLAQKELVQAFQPTLLSEEFFDFAWPKFNYPSSSQAFYSEKLNYLVLPVGVIDTSLFSQASVNSTVADIPSIQYGSLGVLMAQLILQGFDEQGSYRSDLGNIAPWWDSETRENYRNLTECFRAQYNDTVGADGVGVTGDEGQNVTKDNISQRKKLLRQLFLQNGALALAYQAYHSKTFEQEFDEYLLPGLQDYTPEQLFFLSYAQSQCSPHAASTRKQVVKNVLGNSVEFARHWNCPLPAEESLC